MTIPNKAEFNKLSQRGLLGNYLRTWKTLAEALASDAEWFTIQGTAPQSLYFRPVVARYALILTVSALQNLGAKTTDIYFREIPSPETARLYNAEAGRSQTQRVAESTGMDHSRMYLYVKHGAMPSVTNLRDDLNQNGVVLTNLRANHFLQASMGGEIDTLTDIWDWYPDAIIECSLFSRPVGVFRNKLVIWEVRNF